MKATPTIALFIIMINQFFSNLKMKPHYLLIIKPYIKNPIIRFIKYYYN